MRQIGINGNKRETNGDSDKVSHEKKRIKSNNMKTTKKKKKRQKI